MELPITTGTSDQLSAYLLVGCPSLSIRMVISSRLTASRSSSSLASRGSNLVPVVNRSCNFPVPV